MTQSTTPILDRLKTEAIFSIEEHTHGRFTLTEERERYHSHTLTRCELRQLGAEISRLAISSEVTQ